MSEPSLKSKACHLLGIDLILTFADAASPDDSEFSSDSLIYGLCQQSRYHEALCIACHSSTFYVKGSGSDCLEPLSAMSTSIVITSDSGLGLFISLLTSQCCDQQNTPPSNLSVAVEHCVRPLSSREVEDRGWNIDQLWNFLSLVLKSFDGPLVGNWGLHRVAAVTCMKCRPGKKIPEIIVRSYCGDLISPIADEKGRGDAVGLMRCMYEHGHLLEACELCTRVIYEYLDARNKQTRNTRKLPFVPVISYAFLDSLISAIDRTLELATSGGMSDVNALPCAVLSQSQNSLKNSVKIMIKLQQLNSYSNSDA